MKRVRLFRLGMGKTLLRTDNWVDAGTELELGERRQLFYDHAWQSVFPVEGVDNRYVLERELEEVHEPSPAV